MNSVDYFRFFDELDDDDALDAFLQFDAQRPRNPKGRLTRKLEQEERAFIAAQDEARSNFKFTYQASQHEADWLLDSLQLFYEQRWISDIWLKIKGGKEASVFLCRSGTAVDSEVLAAKVYRPRMLRNLKNDRLYRVGRIDLDEDGLPIVKDAPLNAIRKRTPYGEKLRHQSWIAYEFKALQILYQAGANVPKPYAMGNNAILMTYIGEPGQAAPVLHSLRLPVDEAERLFSITVENIDLMLAHGLVHADLSAYNILYWAGGYWAGGITLIDFPQVVDPDGNPVAWELFQRDVARVCEYFTAQGVECNSYALAATLWNKHGRRVTRSADPRYLDAEDPEDRKAWERER